MSNKLRTIERMELEVNSIDEKRSIRASKLRSFYETLAAQLFQQFEPTKKVSQRVSRDFMVRLNDWLEHYEDHEDQWIAFRSIEYLFFAGQQEFEELYRCAFDNIIKPWLVDMASIDIFSPDASERLDIELEAVWPCPVTDSLRINGFLHLTGLSGKSLRPDWLSMRQFSCPAKIKLYQVKEGIKYLVLIEDFVGSGGQVSRALRFAAAEFEGPILLIPLLVCAPGDRKIKGVISDLKRKNIHYKPVTVLADECLVSEVPNISEPKLFSDLRNIMKTGYKTMNFNLDGEEFGWKKIGSLVVMYSNCPNNTPPIFHHRTTTWNPLFPRSERELKVIA
ncbi:phosphoribosyltransferase-like protein [Pseudomonas khavaziana]|uniref:PRTase-CE domain-containing protein n=1 Tax=Pseudomonas khavaziana TaxID=2842351 RepID=A0ABZ2DIE3_9PSED